ncbi:ABC transporter permease [cf. Phormidesmis sp. LEGE 11477]|uniref:ABC transporter permease n=1 Tax=cf. Phormidesmis sp. LEGE 11477 TaxID=1828680 RepID=UPI001882187E|nr:ABC transporter permease [cf. Phormidesmis sp. LEGE 11477]MBE9062792.1 ABC transporter permease [cf. Phormidesmis sp. LEGE 11477]
MARSSTITLVTRRTFAAIPSVFGVIVLTFILTRALPGDPAAYFAGPAASQEAIAQIRETLGLNRSLPEQFVIYLGELARGDLGSSLTTGQTVLSDLLTRLPASLELTLAGLFFSLTLAIPLGILAATRPGSWIDHGVRVLATAGVSLPTFFTGLLLIYVFYFLFGIAPAPLGRLDILYSPPRSVTGLYLIDSLLAGNLEIFWAALSQLFLPAVTLGLFALAPLARVTRAAMLAVLSSDFIRTARASGLSATTVLFGYAFRNALLPIVTTLGVVFSFLLGANVLVEKVFSWPGIGSYAVSALVASDYAAVQGFVLTMALLYVVLNLLIDLLYVVIDPRAGVES